MYPNGYWPREMTEGERAASVEIFSREIYPIWKGIEDRDIAADNKLTMEQANNPGQMLFEAATIHKQDLAILSSGIKPNQISSEKEVMAELRRKAVRASGGR